MSRRDHAIMILEFVIFMSGSYRTTNSTYMPRQNFGRFVSDEFSVM